MSTHDYTIGDLLAEPELGIELAVGDGDALQRPILGAHSIELENPEKWLDRGWMMLTMGVRLRGEPTLQRQLVQDLKAIDASCLGVGIGLAFRELPGPLVEEAAKLNLPVLLVPEETQFRDITRAVFQSTVGIESRTFRRLSSIQQNLIRAFADENPLESIVRRLGRLVNAVVAVVAADGEIVVATGSLPVVRLLTAAMRDYSGLIRPLMVDEWKVLGSPVGDSQPNSGRWLIVASSGTTVADDLSRAAMQVTVPLLDALDQMSVTTRNQDRAIREALLDAMLDGADEIDRKTLGARVSAVGLEFSIGVRVVVVRLENMSTEEQELDDIASWLNDEMERASVRYLLSRRANEIVIAHQINDRADATIDNLLSFSVESQVGIGRVVTSPEEIRVAWHDAQIAVQHLSLQTEARKLAFEDLELVTQILAEVPLERLGPKLDSMTHLLREQPIQLEALRAYFSHNRDIKAAAASIFLHPNTLRYRLERFDAALGGRSLQEPVMIASVYCLLTLLSDADILGDLDASDDRL